MASSGLNNSGTSQEDPAFHSKIKLQKSQISYATQATRSNTKSLPPQNLSDAEASYVDGKSSSVRKPSQQSDRMSMTSGRTGILQETGQRMLKQADLEGFT